MALDSKRKLDFAIAAVATTAVTLLAAGAANAQPISPAAGASILIQLQVD